MLLLRHLAGAAALAGALAGAARADDGAGWVRRDAQLRLGVENVSLPGGDAMGLVGATYAVELRPGLCAGPAVYGSATGRYGGLFVVGAEAAWCTALAGRLRFEAGVFVGGGGGGGAPVGGGLMLRPHADLLWDAGPWRAVVSLSRVEFPDGEIASNQLGLVFALRSPFDTLPAGASAPAGAPARSGFGVDRVLGVAGVYRLASGSTGNSGAPIGPEIGLVGLRAERWLTRTVYAGVEASGAASGGAGGYAELLGEIGVETALADTGLAVGARVALGMGGGGAVPVGGGLLGKAALTADLALAPTLGLAAEAGWVRAPQGSLSAPMASLALRWSLNGEPGKTVLQTFSGGIEILRTAARRSGPPQDVQSVSLGVSRFVAESVYLTGQVRSAYAGDAGAYAAGLLGVGARVQPAPGWTLGAELLAGAAGGGGVDTGSGAIVQPLAYVGVGVTPALALRLGVGRVKAIGGDLDSTTLDLTLAFAFGVGG